MNVSQHRDGSDIQTYLLLCDALRPGVDGSFEPYGTDIRCTDASLGKQLGTSDHQIVWTTPKTPHWMSRAECEHKPVPLRVRELLLIFSGLGRPGSARWHQGLPGVDERL
jgi:hypothetical protein